MAHPYIVGDILRISVYSLDTFSLFGDHMRKLLEDLAEFCNGRLNGLDGRGALLDVRILLFDELHLHEGAAVVAAHSLFCCVEIECEDISSWGSAFAFWIGTAVAHGIEGTAVEHWGYI